MRKLLFTFFFVCFCQFAQATTYYVTTAGSGSTCSVGTPCGSIVTGISKLTVAGDVLNIAAGTYTESSSASLPASGSSGNRIRIVGAGASTTIWQRSGGSVSGYGGAIQGIDRSYIEITGINFKNIKTKTVIDNNAQTSTATDWWIHSVTFEGNGTQGSHSCSKSGFIADRCGADDASRIINFRGPFSPDAVGLNFSNNTLDGNYGYNFSGDIGSSTFSNNIQTNQHSSKGGASNGYQYVFRLLSQQGGCTGCESNTISGNDLGMSEKDSFVSGSDCGPSQTATCKWQGTGIKGDTGAANNTIKNNVIHDVNTAFAANVVLQAIFYESGCNSNTILNNVIYNVGGAGIKIGSIGTGLAATNVVDGNSLFNCECGISLMRASQITVKNNIDHRGTFTNNGAFIIRSDLSPGPHTFKNNLIYDATSATTNWTGTTSTVSECTTSNVSYASWQSTYSETNSIGPSSDPLYLDTTAPSPLDLHVNSSTSPALDAGDLGQDMGAYPLENPPPSVTISLTFPNGGDNLVSGSVANITWQTSQTGNCKIELARDGSNFSEVLSASTTCTNQTYAWSVTPPGRISTAKFKVTSLSDGAVNDTSDAGVNIRGKYVSVIP